MDTPTPLVSGAVPTRNRSASLIRTLTTVLEQSYPAIEGVVMDNASDDDTAERVAPLLERIVYVRHPQNIGMIANFNACLEQATGDYFLLLSDDDYLEPEAITHLVAPFLRPSPTTSPQAVSVVWCPVHIIDETGRQMWISNAGPSHR